MAHNTVEKFLIKGCPCNQFVVSCYGKTSMQWRHFHFKFYIITPIAPEIRIYAKEKFSSANNLILSARSDLTLYAMALSPNGWDKE